MKAAIPAQHLSLFEASGNMKNNTNNSNSNINATFSNRNHTDAPFVPQHERNAFEFIKHKSADIFENSYKYQSNPSGNSMTENYMNKNVMQYDLKVNNMKRKGWNADISNPNVLINKRKYPNGNNQYNGDSNGSSSSGPASSSDESDEDLQSVLNEGMNRSENSTLVYSDGNIVEDRYSTQSSSNLDKSVMYTPTDTTTSSMGIRSKRERKDSIRYDDSYDMDVTEEEVMRPGMSGRGRKRAQFDTMDTEYRMEASEDSRVHTDSSDFHHHEERTRRGTGYTRKSYLNNRSSKSGDVYHIGRVGIVSGRTSNLREKKSVNYAEIQDGYETDEEDRIIDEQREQYQVEQKFVQGVDRVLSHQVDPETGVTSYLIKWKGQAHLHNTLEVYESLQRMCGIKKVDNYIRRLQEMEKRRATMTLDEIEQEDIAYELQRQIDEDALIAERIVEVSPDPSTGAQTFLIKWKSCPYDQCTWEVEETIINHNFSHLVAAFFEREDRIHGKAAMSSTWNTQSLGRTKFEPYSETPSYMFQDATRKLRDYQLTGLNWMVSRMKYGLSVLLADEMGLGKTVQTISLVGHMLYTENCVGPYLVIVPQSTIDNWMREFQYWMPKANVVCFHGNAVGRDILRYYELRQVNVREKGKRWRFDVCIVAPSILNCQADVEFLRKICWQLMVVDEAHQLKNRNSKRFQELRLFQAEYKLLLSGTPLHNNLEELWSLLHFMNPLKYAYYEDFRRRYPDIENTAAIGEAKQKQLASLQAELHEVVLRRVKKDVEKSLPNKVESILQVEMSPYQESWYENVYTRNYDQLARNSGGARSSLQNICMELKKVCNHPFLCAYPQTTAQYQNGLVHGSGKMCLLEKLLFRLKEKGHRVLIFSQMVRMLNIISDYLIQRGLRHQRLDGSMGKELRKKAMDHFNDPDSDDFAFLLSTKAGGLGINLTTADTVIIYDSDWNPQNDLQAEARAHRIGQTKTVQIYRLVTKNSIEQGILERAKTKLVLDTLVVQGLNKRPNGASDIFVNGAQQSSSFTREELSKILKFGASNLWKKHESKPTLEQGVDVDLDKVLSEAQVTVSEETGVADDLLSSFNNITEFRYEPPQEENMTNDKDFWTSTIPLEERLKCKMEKEQELVVSGPRRTRAKDGFAAKGEEEDYEDSDADAGDTFRRKKGGKHRKKAAHMSDKDRYRLYRSLLKFGIPTSRLEDIHEDSRLVKFDRKLIYEECKDIIRICKKRLQEIGYKHSYTDDTEASSQLNGDSKKDDCDSLANIGATARHFVGIGDNKANAVDLIERVELLSMLDKYMKLQNPGCAEPWKLPAGLLPVDGKIKRSGSTGEQSNRILKLTLPDKVMKRLKGWTAKDVKSWGPIEDVNLVKGTYMYGFGSWTEVHTDPNLNLSQVKDIKFDKVKMRALRTLKLLEAANTEVKQKDKRKHTNEFGFGDAVTPTTEGASTVEEKRISESNESKLGKGKRKKAIKDENMESDAIVKKPKPRPAAEVMPTVSINMEELTRQARKVLKSVKKPLKDMRNMTNDEGCSDHQVIGLMKRSLPLVGNKIEEALRKCTDPCFKVVLEEACWKYVSKYTIASAEDLKRVYLQLQSLAETDVSHNWEESAVPPEGTSEEAEVPSEAPSANPIQETAEFPPSSSSSDKLVETAEADCAAAPLHTHNETTATTSTEIEVEGVADS